MTFDTKRKCYKMPGRYSVSLNDVALFSKEWHFSDEWEQLSPEETMPHEDYEHQNEKPLLNTEEIASLLGHYKSPQQQTTSGLEHLLEVKDLSYYDFAFLDNILERFPQECQDSWRSIFSINANLEYIGGSKSLISLKDYMDQASIQGITKVIKSKQSHLPFFINFDLECLQLLIESLLGGCQSASSLSHHKRPLTKIERNISLYFVRSLLSSFEKIFSKFVPYELYLEEQDNLLELITLNHFSETALLTKLMLEINSTKSFINMVFPLAFLEDFKQKLENEKHINSQKYTMIWQDYLAKELTQTNLLIEAKLSTLTFPLKEILHWRIGTQITLPLNLSSLATLECGGFELMKGEIGQCENSIAIQIKRNKLASIKEEK